MRKTIKVLTVGGVAFGLVLTVSLFSTSTAQERNNKVEKAVEASIKDKSEGREAVAKSVAGSVLFDVVLAKESDWKLQKASNGIKRTPDDSTVIRMLYQKDKDDVYVRISEFNTAEDAANTYNIPRSYGNSVSFNRFGEFGEKIYGDRNGFIMLSFCKGNFKISITTKDEKTAERFAGYALEAVGGLATK